MQLQRMLVYSLCVMSIGAWYKEAKSCCPYDADYGYTYGNNSVELWEYCPSDGRWCPKPEEKQEAKVVAVKNYIDNKKIEATKPVREVAQYDIRWQEEEQEKTITSYDIRAGKQKLENK
jgi:hypothetical protein